MKQKLLGFALASIFLTLLLTPLAVAKPGEEKTNEKFMPFELRLIGAGDPETGREWQTPPEPAEAETTHVRDREWVNTELTLTVGSEVYTFDSAPVYVTYYGTMDIDTNIRTIEEGSANIQHVRVTETITFYNEEDEVIGTLEFDVRDMTVMQGDFPPNPPKISGTFVVHGTGALKGVEAIGTDTMVGPPLTVVRTGQVMNWPDLS